MAPTRSTKPPSCIAELYDFARNAGGIEYGALGKAFEDAGWRWRLREAGAQPMPDGSVLMSYDFMVGRSIDALEVLDTVTMHMNGAPGPVSLAARVALLPTLIYLVFGRLPPQPVQPAAPTPPTQPNGTYNIDMSHGDAVLPDDDGGEAVADDVPTLDLVAKREPDGLPIFIDVYAVGEDSGVVIDTLLAEIEGFLRTASAPEQLVALWHKNEDAMTFIKDLGDDTDRSRLKGMFDQHKDRLTREPVARTAQPRRRPAPARH